MLHEGVQDAKGNFIHWITICILVNVTHCCFQLEEEVANIYCVHEDLKQTCERREKLEHAARLRLQSDLHRVQQLNKVMKDQMDILQSQLMEPDEHQVLIAQLFTQSMYTGTQLLLKVFCFNLIFFFFQIKNLVRPKNVKISSWLLSGLHYRNNATISVYWTRHWPMLSTISGDSRRNCAANRCISSNYICRAQCSHKPNRTITTERWG